MPETNNATDLVENENSVNDENGTWKGDFFLDKDTDQQLIDFLEQSDDKNQQIVNLLNLGRAVQLAATFSTSDDSLRQLLKPLDDRIISLNQTIETFQGKTKNASVIGTMGEEIAKNQFTERFASFGDSFEINSTTGHVTDIHGKIRVDHDTRQELVHVYIEAKEYTKPVTTEEINKFWTDMEQGAPNYGMLISFKQKITGKANAIEVERRGNKLVFFIANETHDDLRHIVAWELLRYIVRSDLQNNSVGSGVSRQMETMLVNLNEELEKLNTIETSLGQITRTGQNLLKNAGQSAQELFSTEAKVRVMIEDTKRNLKKLIIGAGDEYSKAMKELVDWRQNVMLMAFSEFSNDQIALLMPIEPSITNHREICNFNVLDDGKTVELYSTANEEQMITFESQAKNLVLSFNYDIDQELADSLGGKVTKGVLKISLNPAKKDYPKHPFASIREVIEGIFIAP